MQSGEYPEWASEQARRNRRVLARSALFTLPVIGGFAYGSWRMSSDSGCGMAPEMLFGAVMFAMISVLMTGSGIFSGVMWLAQKAPTPILRFALAFGLLALPFFFAPGVALVFPFLLIGIVARSGWREGSAQATPKSDISPAVLAALRLAGQAACGALMAVAWELTREMLRAFVDYGMVRWMVAAVTANVWFWLIVLIAGTTWRAAVEPERGTA